MKSERREWRRACLDGEKIVERFESENPAVASVRKKWWLGEGRKCS